MLSSSQHQSFSLSKESFLEIQLYSSIFFLFIDNFYNHITQNSLLSRNATNYISVSQMNVITHTHYYKRNEYYYSYYILFRRVHRPYNIHIYKLSHNKLSN